MSAPKTAERPVSFRTTEEVLSDARMAADRMGISLGKYINNALLMALKMPWVIQADWYSLRQLNPYTLRLHGKNLSDADMN